MALTRKLLKSFGLEESVVDSILEAHSETVEALKKQRDDALAEAGKSSDVTKERDELKNKLEELQKKGDPVKIQADFDAYKNRVESEKTNAGKTAAARKALKSAGVEREEFLDLLMGKVDLGKVELDGDAVKDADTLVSGLKQAYPGCFAATGTVGTPASNPPTGHSVRMSKDDILNIKDGAERRAAMAANLDLFK